MNSPIQFSILIAEDDADDRLMIQEAFQESGTPHYLQFVQDGHELITHLHKLVLQPVQNLPSIIVIDLNMPRKDGREALREIKQNPQLGHIPVIVLTTSKAPEDIRNSYMLGANCYITKPVTFDALLRMTQTFNAFWFEMVRLP